MALAGCSEERQPRSHRDNEPITKEQKASASASAAGAPDGVSPADPVERYEAVVVLSGFDALSASEGKDRIVDALVRGGPRPPETAFAVETVRFSISERLFMRTFDTTDPGGRAVSLKNVSRRTPGTRFNLREACGGPPLSTTDRFVFGKGQDAFIEMEDSCENALSPPTDLKPQETSCRVQRQRWAFAEAGGRKPFEVRRVDKICDESRWPVNWEIWWLTAPADLRTKGVPEFVEFVKPLVAHKELKFPDLESLPRGARLM